MSYRDRLRKTITLPSGATIVIHKLNTFNEPFLTTRRRNCDGDNDIESGVRLAKFALSNPNNGPLTFDGESLRIVDKDEAGEGEITISQLEQSDADTIFKAVLEFSELTKAGQEARATFPEGQEAGGSTSPNGGVVPLHTNGPAEVATG